MLVATSIDNFISMIIIVWLLKMQMAQGFLKQLRKHLSFEEDKMKVDSGVSPLSVSSVNFQILQGKMTALMQ